MSSDAKLPPVKPQNPIYQLHSDGPPSDQEYQVVHIKRSKYTIRDEDLKAPRLLLADLLFLSNDEVKLMNAIMSMLSH